MALIGFILFFIGMATPIYVLQQDQFFPWRAALNVCAVLSGVGFLMIFFGTMPK
jgi:uncharacterized membrane protein